MPKRKRPQGLEEPADLHILVTRRDEPLRGHRGFLSYFSTVISDLPPGESGAVPAWDLREVVLEGGSLPVDAVTVQTWLDFTYKRLDDTWPVSVPNCLAACLRLLKFADFAGTRESVLRDIGSSMAQNQRAYLEVAVDEQHKPHLLLHGVVHFRSMNGLCAGFPSKAAQADVLVRDDVFQPKLQRFRETVSAALEAALYLAARLDLAPLVLMLRNFVLNQLSLYPNDGWVMDPRPIYSPRVLRNLPREVLMEAFLERAFTDLSAEAKLHTSAEMGVEFESPIPPWYLGLKRPGERINGLRLESSRAGQLLVGNASNGLRAQTIIGGLSTEHRRVLVQELLKDTVDAAGAEGLGSDAAA